MAQFFKHKKTGKIYALVGDAINATNKEDGTKMKVYRLDNDTQLFVREEVEFLEKFEAVDYSLSTIKEL